MNRSTTPRGLLRRLLGDPGDRQRGFAEAGVALTGAALVLGAALGSGVASTVVTMSDGVTWLPDDETGQVVQVNPGTGRAERRLQVAEPGSELQVSQRDGRLVVTDATSGTATSIDLATLMAGGQRRTQEPARVLVGGGQMYLVSTAGGVVRAVDPLTLRDLGSPHRLGHALADAVVDDRGAVWVVTTAGDVRSVSWLPEQRRFDVGEARPVRGAGAGTRLLPHARGVTVFAPDGGAVLQVGVGRDVAVAVPELSGEVLPASTAPTDLAPAGVPGRSLVVILAGERLLEVHVGDLGCRRPGRPAVFAGLVHVPCTGAGRVLVLRPDGTRARPDVVVPGGDEPRLLVDDGRLVVHSEDGAQAVVVQADGSTKVIDTGRSGAAVHDPRNGGGAPVAAPPPYRRPPPSRQEPAGHEPWRGGAWQGGPWQGGPWHGGPGQDGPPAGPPAPEHAEPGHSEPGHPEPGPTQPGPTPSGSAPVAQPTAPTTQDTGGTSDPTSGTPSPDAAPTPTTRPTSTATPSPGLPLDVPADEVAPVAPTGVAATAHADGTVTVSWTPAPGDVDSYLVGPVGAATTSTHASATSVVLRDVPPGAVSFVVQAALGGQLAASEPSAPVTVVGVPGPVTIREHQAFGFTSDGERQIGLVWDGAAENGSTIETYEVSWSGGGLEGTLTSVEWAAVVKLSCRGLSLCDDGGQVTVTVAARNAVGRGPGASVAVALEPLDLPRDGDDVVASVGVSGPSNGGLGVTMVATLAPPPSWASHPGVCTLIVTRDSVPVSESAVSCTGGDAPVGAFPVGSAPVTVAVRKDGVEGGSVTSAAVVGDVPDHTEWAVGGCAPPMDHITCLPGVVRTPGHLGVALTRDPDVVVVPLHRTSGLPAAPGRPLLTASGVGLLLAAGALRAARRGRPRGPLLPAATGDRTTGAGSGPPWSDAREEHTW